MVQGSCGQTAAGLRLKIMKRDIKLIRTMLLDLETMPAGQATNGFEGPEYEGTTVAEILGHVDLLLDAGFVDGNMVRGGMNEPVGFIIWKMTWAGQEFLANAKNDTIWKKVIAEAEKKGMSTSMTVLNGLLEAAAKKYAGLAK